VLRFVDFWSEPVARKEKHLRFIAAIVSFVIAFMMIGYGIAQRTVLRGPDNVTASVKVDTKAPVTIIDGTALTAMPGRQKVEIGGAPTVFAAYGRTEDVVAWVGKTRHNKVTFNTESTSLTGKLVPGAEQKVPDPAGSDLWLSEYSGKNGLSFTGNVPRGISLLVVSDGVAPAPSSLSVTWPLDNRTPWSGPLLAGGGILLLLGIVLYLWALIALRRSRGPRRKPPKTPKMPKLPRPQSYKAVRPRAIVAAKGRRSIGRMVAVLPVVLIGALATSGCSSELWPNAADIGQASATPSASATLAAEHDPPVVSIPQVEHILAEVSSVATKADTDRDATLLATRFAGPALELRSANYAIRGVDATYAAPTPIPAKPLALTLPQQSKTWPRTVFTVIQDANNAEVKPVALMLTQENPRANYKVQYAVTLEARAVLPKVAPANVGAVRLQEDVPLLGMKPGELALAFGDVLSAGDQSKYADKFDLTDDPLLKQIGLESRNALKAKLPASAQMEYTNIQGAAESVALATSGSGAIVAVYLQENLVVKPVEGGASVNAEGAVKSLSKVTSTTKGTSATYGDQLLFSVPAVGSNEKIVLLGWDTGLVAAKELP
jgi:hypothetical protein